MAQSRQTVPEFALEVDVDDALIASMTLAPDHRILYGADAAAFLVEIRRLLEHPLALAL